VISDTPMTATILLIRHAAHGHLGAILSGRMGGIPLSEEGQAQAKRLRAMLQADALDHVQSSPVQRARETAAAVAGERPVEIVEALHEIDFGDWTGRRFDSLEGDPEWSRWNTLRSQACPPGGENMAQAQQRALDHLRAAAARHPGQTIAMVTHCDVIRAVVAAVLGLSLDHILRFDVDPASVTRVVAGEWGERLVSLNERP
jgi:probable phosphoglycerate mutase